MDERLSDELISAYLDGELSSDEQTQVEELLMDSVEHRKMFNELRALRDSLQSLPNYTLGDDFADRVLRQAERTMLSSDAPPPSAAGVEDKSTGKPAQPEKVQLGDKSWADRGVARGIGWSIAAIAAAIAIAMFFGPRGSDETPRVAGVPDSDELERLEEVWDKETRKEAGKGKEAAEEAQDNANTKRDLRKAETAPAPHDSVEKKIAGVAVRPDEETEADKGGGGRVARGRKDQLTDGKADEVRALGGGAGGEGGRGEQAFALSYANTPSALTRSTETLYLQMDVTVDDLQNEEVHAVLKETGVPELVPENLLQEQLALRTVIDAAAATDRFAQAQLRKQASDEELRNEHVDDYEILVIKASRERAATLLEGLQAKYAGIELVSVSPRQYARYKARDMAVQPLADPQADAFAGPEREFADRANDERDSDDGVPPAAASKGDGKPAPAPAESKDLPADSRSEPGGFGGDAKNELKTARGDAEGGKLDTGAELEKTKKTLQAAEAVELAEGLNEQLPDEYFFQVPIPSVASKRIEASSPLSQRGHNRARVAVTEEKAVGASGRVQSGVAEPSVAPTAPQRVDSQGAGDRLARRAKSTAANVRIVLLIRAAKSPALAADAVKGDAAPAGDAIEKKRAPADSPDSKK